MSIQELPENRSGTIDPRLEIAYNWPVPGKEEGWFLDKNIVFNFPIPIDGGEVKEFPLESESTVETVVLFGGKTGRNGHRKEDSVIRKFWLTAADGGRNNSHGKSL